MATLQKRNKLAIIVPFYKRHDLTALCFENLKRQSIKYGVAVYTAGSEGKASKELSKSFGFNHTEVKNSPLGAKLNSLIKSTKGIYDGVIAFGSDDFISDSIIEMYQKIDCSKPVMYGLNKIHFYSTKSRNLGLYEIEKHQKFTIGASRLYTKKLLKELNFEIWDKTKDRGMDGSTTRLLRAKGFEEIVIDSGDHFILDVKHCLNITNPSIINNTRKENIDILKEKLPEISNKILSLESSDNESIIINKAATKRNSATKRIDMKASKTKVKVLKPFHHLREGDEINLPHQTAKGLVKSGFAEYVLKPVKPVKKEQPKKVENVKEEQAPKEVKVESTEKPDSECSLKELRGRYPQIKATSKAVFLAKIEGLK